VANKAKKRVETSADEQKSGDGENCDDGENESVLRETLSFLAVKAQEHDASFRKRRLAFVATIGRAGAKGIQTQVTRASASE
jgi:hypothetical protein